MVKLTQLFEWKALKQHQCDIKQEKMGDWFANDPKRFKHYCLQTGPLFLDYSRNYITKKTIRLLCQLATACHLSKKIEALFSGVMINLTEQRAALHTALRDQHATSLILNGVNIVQQILAMRKKLQQIVSKLHAKQWLGITGKPITQVVHMGIGGSYLGPLFCTQALKDYRIANKGLPCYFLASTQDSEIRDLFDQIDPETTLFIIASKSFTTLETITNAHIICHWLEKKYGPTIRQKQLIAITAESAKAAAFGIPNEHILPLWDWVTGRYSIWSAISLPLILMIGELHFKDFLQGAYLVDQHFRYSPFHVNMPIVLALLNIWYTNFFNSSAQAIAPYSERLRYLIPYLQQLEMESNGKSVDCHGNPIHYKTSPILFGEEGIQGQHAYHQLLHQGQHLIPIDFIVAHDPFSQKNHSISYGLDNLLLASALSQATALMQGNRVATMNPIQLDPNHAHKTIHGNRPSNILLLEKISPKAIGALLALYEHKAFVEGAIWNINSFDQWGVELSKQLLPSILHQLEHSEISLLDTNIRHCIQRWHQLKSSSISSTIQS